MWFPTGVLTKGVSVPDCVATDDDVGCLCVLVSVDLDSQTRLITCMAVPCKNRGSQGTTRVHPVRARPATGGLPDAVDAMGRRDASTGRGSASPDGGIPLLHSHHLRGPSSVGKDPAEQPITQMPGRLPANGVVPAQACRPVSGCR